MSSAAVVIGALRVKMTIAAIQLTLSKTRQRQIAVVVVGLLFYVHGKHLRSCRDGQLT